jgi:hypothetical protein
MQSDIHDIQAQESIISVLTYLETEIAGSLHKKKCQQAYFPKSKLVQAGPSWSKMVQAASLSTWASLTSLQVGIFALAGRIPPCGHQLTSLKSLPRLPSEDSLKGDR